MHSRHCSNVKLRRSIQGRGGRNSAKREEWSFAKCPREAHKKAGLNPIVSTSSWAVTLFEGGSFAPSLISDRDLPTAVGCGETKETKIVPVCGRPINISFLFFSPLWLAWGLMVQTRCPNGVKMRTKWRNKQTEETWSSSELEPQQIQPMFRI